MVEWLRRLAIPWLVGREVGAADVTSYGTVIDDQIELTKEAVKARMPEECPSDALPYIGNERGLIQGGTVGSFSESDADFGLRLREAWDVWPYAGTPLSLLLQLYYTLGIDNAVIVQQNGLFFTLGAVPEFPPLTDYLNYSTTAALETDLPPDPTRTGFPWFAQTIPAGNPWWLFDNKTDLCNRFVVIFPAPLPASWTDVQNPPTSTSAPTISEVNAIRGMIQQWRNAEAQCVGIIVQTDGLIWGYPTTQVWGAGTGDWGGETVVWSVTP